MFGPLFVIKIFQTKINSPNFCLRNYFDTLFWFHAVQIIHDMGIRIYRTNISNPHLQLISPKTEKAFQQSRLKWNSTFRRELHASATDRQCCSSIKLHQIGFLLCTYRFCCSVLSLHRKIHDFDSHQPQFQPHRAPSKFNLPHFSDSTLCHGFPSFSSQIRPRRQLCMLIAALKLRLVEISEKSSDKSRLVLVMSRENVSIYLRSTLDGPYMKGIPSVNLISLAF